MGVLGLGRWGPNIVRSLESNPKVEVIGGVEPDSVMRTRVKERIPYLPIYSSFNEFLAAKTVHAVFISTPVKTHFDLAKLALSKGIHVMLEKPLAHSSTACRDLIESAKKTDSLLMVGHVFLYNQGISEAKRLIESGELGKILYLRSVRTNLGPIRTDVNVIWDLATHDISMFNYLFGDSPKRVSCVGLAPLEQAQEDVAFGSLVYSNNRSATFFVSWLDPKKTRELTMIGDQKMLKFDDLDAHHSLRVYDKGVRALPSERYVDSFPEFKLQIYSGQETILNVPTGRPLENECNHFIDCIESGRKPFTGGSDGLLVVEILEALMESFRKNGTFVDLNQGIFRSSHEQDTLC